MGQAIADQIPAECLCGNLENPEVIQIAKITAASAKEETYAPLPKLRFEQGQGFRQQGAREIKKNYAIDATAQALSTSTYAMIYGTASRHNQDLKVAIKVYDKLRISKSEKSDELLSAVANEVAVLHTLDHPNIVKYFETYNEKKFVYLVMEFVPGFKLSEKMAQQDNQAFSESQAAHYMKCLLSAVSHCHAQNIYHGDIRPENIIVTERDQPKLIDFSSVKPIYKDEMTDSSDGTQLQEKQDIRALGVILYTLVTGFEPYTEDGVSFSFDPEADPLYNLSSQCMDLVCMLLRDGIADQLTARSALRHPWFRMNITVSPNQKISNEVIARLQRFQGVSILRKAALDLLVKQTSDDEVIDLKAQFQAFNTDQIGLIRAQKLSVVMAEATEPQIRGMIAELDYRDNQTINYSEFLGAIMNSQYFFTEKRLRAVFNIFDTDVDGQISFQNVQVALQKLGREISQEEAQEAIGLHDQDQDGVLSFEEFRAIFLVPTE